MTPRLFLLGLLLALSLEAAPLQVGALRFEPDASWWRADAQEEAEADSLILRRHEPQGEVVLYLPRRQPQLRTDEDGFYRQLTALWRHRHGAEATLDWLTAGGRRWRVLRRPSVETPARTVFQLVTVIDGRAHHALVQAPQAIDSLPAAVLALLEGGQAGDGRGAEGAVSDPETPDDKGTMTVTPDPSASPGPASVEGEVAAGGEAGQGVRRDLAAPPPSQPQAARDETGGVQAWVLLGVMRERPHPALFDRILAAEQAALGPEGAITGLELEARQDGVRARLQGYRWLPGAVGRGGRREFTQSYALAWQPPPERLPPHEPLTVGARAMEGGAPVALRIRLLPLCAPASALEAAARQAGAERVHALEALVCSGMGRTEALIQGGDGRATLIPPAPPSSANPVHLWLELTPQPVGPAPGGRALLEAATVHALYRWE